MGQAPLDVPSSTGPEAAFQRQVSGGSGLTLSPWGCPAGDPSARLRTSGASTAIAAELRSWAPGSWGGPQGGGPRGAGAGPCGGGGTEPSAPADTAAQGFLQTSFFFQILDAGFSGL